MVMSETTLKDGGEGRLHDDRNVATDELLVMLPSFDEVMRQVDELLDGGRHDALQDVGPTLKRLRLSRDRKSVV